MERSKLPVLRPQTLATEHVPCTKKPCPEKPALPLFSKVPNIDFASTVPEFGPSKNVTKGKKAVLAKKTGPPVHGPLTRYRVETELRDRNQLLEAANSSLQSNLLSSQNKVQEMFARQAAMEKDLKELKQRLENNMVVLESCNIDPVSGEQILRDTEELNKIQEENRHGTENLIEELKTFTLACKEQKQTVQSLNTKWKEAEERRKQFKEEQNAFENDMEQFRLCLEQAKKLMAL